MYRPVNHGYIEVVVGPMYSGKSEELIRRLKRAKIAKQNIIVFKPHIDDRYSKKDVVSHSGDSIEAIPIEKPSDIYDLIDEDIQPKYNAVEVHCACGNTFMAGSTKDEIRVEICSECHPFYTGKQKNIEKGGRIDKFKKRFKMD